ncbi:hypothetical protein GALMADRAFT_75234 [Galerina marginata CBS 339.88]|uniref:Uncharacterized protein n=1 Tax=Galerina marginata (strain CBS 339.88) TaxID=685588 RepID=A0A067SK78_GALM3|nr:hypothetical protein GALMADRAFT_75234 [Galerina marginata CBS 339.88]
MAILTASIYLLVTLWVTQIFAIDFSASKWIWTDETNGPSPTSPGSRAFRRDIFLPGQNRFPTNIIMTADDLFTLFINGIQIGSGNDFHIANSFCVWLIPGFNVFAVNVTNGLTVPTPAGLLGTIQIKDNNGFTDTIVSNSGWRSFNGVPVGFQDLAFDDGSWLPANVEADFGGGPWGNTAIPPSASSTLSLTEANWIWSNEISNGNAPVGSRAFRKRFALPPGQSTTSATIAITADNAYSLYLQGNLVGSATDWTQAQQYVVYLVPETAEIDIAVLATNFDGPAGLIVAVELVIDFECASVASFVTDGTWKVTTSVPAGFQAPGFDDSNWQAANVEGKYGVGPWGNVPVSAAIYVS